MQLFNPGHPHVRALSAAKGRDEHSATVRRTETAATLRASARSNAPIGSVRQPRRHAHLNLGRQSKLNAGRTAAPLIVMMAQRWDGKGTCKQTGPSRSKSYPGGRRAAGAQPQQRARREEWTMCARYVQIAIPNKATQYCSLAETPSELDQSQSVTPTLAPLPATRTHMDTHAITPV